MKFRLIDRIYPEHFDEIKGQRHLLSDNAPLRKIISEGSFESLIFVGPPGTGKTCLAKIAGEVLSLPFYRLHAASSGSSELKNIVDSTKSYGKPVLIFIDEIHRFSKVQQDLLLDLIDEKHAKLIGASTENPYFKITPALRSRSMLFTFEPLDRDALKSIFDQSCAEIKKMYDVEHLEVDNEVFERLCEASNGDARRFLNMVEIAAMTSPIKDGEMFLDVSEVEDLLIKMSYSEDEHYDLLSAMIKSIRGSDPDAALVWSKKLLKSGVDAESVFRRLLISASEDIGNAFPDALILANSAYEAFLKVGMPEGDIILSHVVTYLASCPKSNRSYMAGKKAEEYLRASNPYPPENIRHNPAGYKYPFDYGEFVPQSYMKNEKIFYNPSDSGFESKIAQRLKRLWKGIKKYES